MHTKQLGILLRGAGNAHLDGGFHLNGLGRHRDGNRTNETDESSY